MSVLGAPLSVLEFVATNLSYGFNFVVNRAWVDFSLAASAVLMPARMPHTLWRKFVYVMLLSTIIHGLQEGMKSITSSSKNDPKLTDDRINSILIADSQRSVLRR